MVLICKHSSSAIYLLEVKTVLTFPIWQTWRIWHQHVCISMVGSNIDTVTKKYKNQCRGADSVFLRNITWCQNYPKCISISNSLLEIWVWARVFKTFKFITTFVALYMRKPLTNWSASLYSHNVTALQHQVTQLNSEGEKLTGKCEPIKEAQH